MEPSHRPIDPEEAEQRFAEMLAEAGLPPFTSSQYAPELDELQFTWDHGLTIHMDLTGEIGPLEDWERASILSEPCCDCEPIHVYVPGSADDPRTVAPVPGIEVHRGPPLHPDDLAVVDGLPVTSPSRTLIDLAEVMTADELRATFARAQAIGLLDPEALREARSRVEWRPSLAMLDEVIAEFCG